MPVAIACAPEIHRMEDHDGSYDVWKESGVRDRVLVHFDGHLDFDWIADRSPRELLAARSSEDLNRLLAQVTDWNLDERPPRDLIHLGNFICPAIREGMVREFFWVIPDPFWTDPAASRFVHQMLSRLVRRRPAESAPVTRTETGFHLALMGCPVTVCALDHLPSFEEPVLLDIDVDYLVTSRPLGLGAVPYFERAPGAWMGPSEFLRRLQERLIPADRITIAYSVQEGYTPLRYKFFGDRLAEAFARLAGECSDLPDPGSAAGKYRQALEALARGDLPLAGLRWKEMADQDPSYRTPWAIPGLREEALRRWRPPLEIYERMIQLDPGWSHPHLGRGRALWGLKRWEEAETAFHRAAQLDPASSQAAVWLGRAAFRRSDWRTAKRFWEEAVDRDPKEAAGWLGLMRCAGKEKDFEFVLELAGRCPRTLSRWVGFHRLVGWAAWHLGQRRRAGRELSLCVRLFSLGMLEQNLRGWRRLWGSFPGAR